MSCERVKMPSGQTAILCVRNPPMRCKCGRSAGHLCDFPLTGDKAGKTCDAKLCARCLVKQPDGKEFCQAHARYTEAGSV